MPKDDPNSSNSKSLQLSNKSEGDIAGRDVNMNVPKDDSSSSKSKVLQISNKAEGDIAGRDVNKIELHNHVHVRGNTATSILRTMANELQGKINSDPQFKGYIDELQHFINELPNTDFTGLQPKLEKANRTDSLNSAYALKERFTKKLTKHQFSEHAQKFFSQILGGIYSNFDLLVRPMILEGATREEVDLRIMNDIIKPIHEQVAEPTLNITMADIQGMIYFLTGNCHISWH